MALRYSVCEEDRIKFGVPEWVVYDKDVLDDIPFDELDPWDREMLDLWGCSINELLALEFLKSTGRSIMGVVWLACKMSHIEVGPLKDFNIRTRKVRLQSLKRADVGADADPPAQTSSGSSSEEAASETASNA